MFTFTAIGKRRRHSTVSHPTPSTTATTQAAATPNAARTEPGRSDTAGEDGTWYGAVSYKAQLAPACITEKWRPQFTQKPARLSTAALQTTAKLRTVQMRCGARGQLSSRVWARLAARGADY